MVNLLSSVGKLNPEMLKQIVFRNLGSSDPRVIVGPEIGEDAAVIEFGNKVLVVHSDPITGAVKDIGRLAVNICANDIASRGVKPRWVLIVMLLPQNIEVTRLTEINSQVNEAARELNVAIIGGHSEVTPGIDRPIIIATAIGEAKKDSFVRSSGAQIGDVIIVTKGAAIEGTAILSRELAGTLQKKIKKDIVERGQGFTKMISIVEDALTAMEVGGVHAMHDATEGGIAGALQEIAWASNVGIIAYEDQIPIFVETNIICRTLNIDPLKTISSGALLISAHPKKAERIIATLQKRGIPSAIIGKVVNKLMGTYIHRCNGTRLELSEHVEEELWKALDSSEF